jgi:hypothetical protein
MFYRNQSFSEQQLDYTDSTKDTLTEFGKNMLFLFGQNQICLLRGTVILSKL